MKFAVDVFVVLILTGLLLVYWKDVRELLEHFSRRPPGPMGPLPSADTHLLLRRRKNSADL